MGNGVSSHFYRGNHKEVTRLLEKKAGQLSASDLPLWVGSLCFLGKLEEAEAAIAENPDLPEDVLAACRFYLGVGFSRVSQYEKGSQYFTQNLWAFRHSPSPLIRFYTYQGLGFFRYLQCHYRQGAHWAQKSFLSATKAKFPYGRYLASDLLGVTLVLGGETSRGLEALREAEALADKLGGGSWAQAAKVAILCYESQFGLKPKTVLKDLDALYGQLTNDLSYLRSGILLEKARQLALRGKLRDSDAILNEASRIVYASRHKRHSLLLHLRLSQNRFLKGQLYEALHLVRACSTDLNPQVDQQLYLSLKGMESKVCTALNLPVDVEALPTLTERAGTSLAKRILSRAQSPLSAPPGEDALGDLLDLVKQAPKQGIKQAAALGYHGLLLPLLPKTSSQVSLFPDFLAGHLVVREEGDVSVKPNPNSPLLKKLLAILGQGEASKERLVQELWGYDYHPLRHDPLLYRIVGRLRHYLGKHRTWIEATPTGYRLQHVIEVFCEAEPVPVAKVASAGMTSTTLSQLNYRQLEILDWLTDTGFVGPKEVQKRFKVSPMTACRDLSTLYRLKHLQRIGKGRATRYCLTSRRRSARASEANS